MVFINETTVNKKTYECQCSVNDVNTVVTYDYSAKKPKATVKTNGTEEIVKNETVSTADAMIFVI